MLFQHEGFRSLWPVVLFLPWIVIGIAYLLGAMAHATKAVRPLLISGRPAQPARNARWTNHTRAMRAMAAEPRGRNPCR
jgi:hypothetical protein